MPNKCIIDGCDVRPNFNYPDQKRGLYCCSHKKDGMEDVIHPKCEFEGCDVRPNFNYPDQKRGLYCCSHKKDGMTDVVNTICLFEGCDVRPCFNYPDQKRGLYCCSHKKDGMEDVIHPKCEFEGCNIQPKFNYPEKKGGLYCCSHKKDTMIDVMNPTCKSTFCNVLLNRINKSKYDEYCTHCFANLFPNDIRTLTIRKKSTEIFVLSYINANFDGFYHDKPIIFNTEICDCTSRRRIDCWKLIDGTMLAIEIDEDQHKNYSKKDEEARYNDLVMFHTGKWIFIRLNTCKFINNKGKKVNPNITQRMECLKQNIERHICRILSNKNINLLEIYYLYYNADIENILV